MSHGDLKQKVKYYKIRDEKSSDRLGSELFC